MGHLAALPPAPLLLGQGGQRGRILLLGGEEAVGVDEAMEELRVAGVPSLHALDRDVLGGLLPLWLVVIAEREQQMARTGDGRHASTPRDVTQVAGHPHVEVLASNLVDERLALRQGAGESFVQAGHGWGV